MPLVTEKIAENSARCKECPVKQLRSKAEEKNTLSDILVQIVEKKGALKTADTLMIAGCKLCPFETDFKTVYGKTPFEYFT